MLTETQVLFLVVLSPPQSSQGDHPQQEKTEPKGPRGAQNQKETWTQTGLEEQVQT